MLVVTRQHVVAVRHSRSSGTAVATSHAGADFCDRTHNHREDSVIAEEKRLARGIGAASQGEEERLYGALALCDLDGDEHTTGVLLDALGIKA